MSALFSFTDSPVMNAMKHLIKLLPGIRKVVALSYSQEFECLKAKYILDSDTEVQELSIENFGEELDKIRSKSIYFKWIKKEDVPFEVKIEKKSIQMNVFDELDVRILLLSIKNAYDDKNDLIYIYFNPNLSNFGISDTSDLLTPEHKKIIGFILYNNVKNLIDSANNDLQTLKIVNENTRSIIGKLHHANDALNKTKNLFAHSLIDLCNVYLNELSIKYNRFKYVFSDNALLKIKCYQGDLIILRRIIEQGVIFVNSLFCDTNKEEIILHEEYFNFDQQITKPEKSDLTAVSSDRYTKTIQLLDKLEKAARDVISMNQEITGANVGKACSIPISAPAITDALKKHRNKIIYLFGKYQDKWATIRNDFKPVKNIISPRNHLFDKSA